MTCISVFLLICLPISSPIFQKSPHNTERHIGSIFICHQRRIIYGHSACLAPIRPELSPEFIIFSFPFDNERVVVNEIAALSSRWYKNRKMISFGDDEDFGELFPVIILGNLNIP